MKKILSITIVLIMICAVGYGVLASRKGTALSPKTESRSQREQRRAARQAAFEKQTDSIVLSRNFQFTPTTMQQQIAGPLKTLINPNFEVEVWDGSADIFLPYVKGYAPPYHYTVLNYTLPELDGYTTEQTADGWMVTFESSLFSSSAYTFVFDISSRYGTTTLTVKNPWYNDVQYVGNISGLR